MFHSLPLPIACFKSVPFKWRCQSFWQITGWQWTVDWKGRRTQQSPRNLRRCSLLYVEELRQATKLYIKLVPIPAAIRTESFWIGVGSGTAWASQSGSIESYCITVVAFLAMYRLQLYPESTEIIVDCFGKLQSTGRESLVVYFIAFVNGFPHANSKATLTSIDVCPWIVSRFIPKLQVKIIRINFLQHSRV